MIFGADAGQKLRSGLPELLAPAGSPESFKAAVAAGADAIYLSGKRFGARKFAANFSDADIVEAVRYAHAWGVRVYVTVNTLIHDRELKGVMEYLCWLYSIGVDAVLVQDTGVLALAREYLPGLTLHASTQMTIHNTPGVRWAAEQGIARVVLARELSLAEVERIFQNTQDTGVGLEVFVHGALCYSYSGQCLLSSLIGGRSGNRGMCAQPCRKPYTLVTGETDEYGRLVNAKEVPLKSRYLLSPKDLCTYHHLPELVRSPIASLKIEGRMKSPEYVAIVTSIYRRALDAIAAGTWKPSKEDYKNLLLAFNRGFTGGYLFNERYEKLMGRDAPDNRGLLIGKIEYYDKKTRTATIRSTRPGVPSTGDGLLITDPAHPVQELGFALNVPPVPTKTGFSLPLPAPVPVGAEVYITASRELAAMARRIVAKPYPELRRQIPIDLSISITQDGTVRFEGTILRPDGVSLPVTYSSQQRMEPARTHPLSTEQLEQQFQKTGDTPFRIRELSIQYTGNLFAPAAIINAMRREFLLQASDLLQASYLPDPASVKTIRQRIQADFSGSSPGPDKTPLPPQGNMPHLRLMVFTDTLDGVRMAATAGADTICFEPSFSISGRHTCIPTTPDTIQSQILAAIEIGKGEKKELVWKFPRIAHDFELDLLLSELEHLGNCGLAGCMSENPGISYAIHALAPGIPLLGAGGLNIFNHRTAETLFPPYSLFTVSPELSRGEIRELIHTLNKEGTAPGSCAIVVQGNGEMMITQDCIARLIQSCGRTQSGSMERQVLTGLWIRDDTGRTYPVIPDGACRTHIGNSTDISLIAHLSELAGMGITNLIIDARNRSPPYTGAVTRTYHDAIRIPDRVSGSDRDAKLIQLKREIQDIMPGNGSPGHFLQGLRD
jgi:putative protease